MTVKQISVFLENKPGTLQELCKVLAENDIDMRALSLAETKDFGIARIIVNSLIDAGDVLKNAGFIYKITPVVAARIPDETGGLHTILEILSKHQINLEYMYAFLGNAQDGATMILRVGDDTKPATEALRGAGIELMTQDDLASM